MKASTTQRSSSLVQATVRLAVLLLLVVVSSVMSIKGMNVDNLVGLARSSLLTTITQGSNPSFRLLIGILMLPDNYRRRQLLRQLYSLQSHAQVDVKFVLCNLTTEEQRVFVALEIMRYNDIIILNCTEDMKSRKSFVYFSSLPDMLDSGVGYSRPYDYVMKADDESYVRLDRLVESLTPLPKREVFQGFVIPCSEQGVSGMGYTLSWDLVEWINSSGRGKNKTDGTEDWFIGERVREGKMGKKRYYFPAEVAEKPCSKVFALDTIAVYGLQDQWKWIRMLQYFNVTQQLKPSKLYHVPEIDS